MKPASLILWHRRLAWVAAAMLALWAGSGALHPLMSWLSPRPVAFTPPAAQEMQAKGWVKPEAALRSSGIAEVRAARYLVHEGRAVLQITLHDIPERRYVDAASGEPIPDADLARAVLLARHYSGEKAAVLGAELQTRFERSYPSINQYLPVWKVRFDTPDDLTVYVDTGSDRLAAIHNRTRLALLYAFQIVHTLDFLEPAEALRLLIIAFGVVTLLAVSGLGMALLYTLKRPKTPKGARGWHRRMAWAMWLPLSCFGVSGLLHLFAHSAITAPPPDEAPRFAADQMPALPAMKEGFTDARLVHGANGAEWRIAHNAGKSISLFGRETSRPEQDTLFERFPDADTHIAPMLVTRFGPEYGFAYKRLPVWRLAMKNGDLLFFDPVDQVVAHRASAFKRTEAWSFSTLHKWQFLDAFGIKQKDAFLMAAACLMLAFAVTGMRLLLRRR